MTTEHPLAAALPDPYAQMERELIAEYFRCQLRKQQSGGSLSADARRLLLIDASRYASTKLAEVETRARLIHAVRGTVHPRPFA